MEAVPSSRFEHVPMLVGDFPGLRRDSVGEFTDLVVRSPVPYNFSEYLAFLGNQIKEVQLAEKCYLTFEEPSEDIREFCSSRAWGRFFLLPRFLFT